ncbi:hypothetical protein CMUS01_02019 [Colletotrichum musicola]|uniref:Uncharacterized protein n=1 Tax=Colletotrichum musicola TaxID=2175873 RepID=A0A8H6NVV7_9PEZI|nr:hypothetical protein CMUS01_02019 [Colletotrichum musicola]
MKLCTAIIRAELAKAWQDLGLDTPTKLPPMTECKLRLGADPDHEASIAASFAMRLSRKPGGPVHATEVPCSPSPSFVRWDAAPTLDGTVATVSMQVDRPSSPIPQLHHGFEETGSSGQGPRGKSHSLGGCGTAYCPAQPECHVTHRTPSPSWSGPGLCEPCRSKDGQSAHEAIR